MLVNELKLLGAPIPAARPRVKRNGFTFDPKAKEKSVAKKLVINQWNREPLKEPLSVDILFEMPIPKSISKKKRAQLIGQPHVIKPDCDNLAKFVLDVMNDVIYSDDSCVYDLHVTKNYSADPKTVIKIIKI